MTEQFKPLSSDLRYEIGNLGTVRSIPHTREVKCGWGGTMVKRFGGKTLRPCTAGAGYLMVSLGCKAKAYVHRLVAEVWLGETPSKYYEVNHKNGIKADNGAANLEWVTRSGNQLHSTHVLHKTAGQFPPKLSSEEKNSMRMLRHCAGRPVAELAELFKVSKATVSRTCR